MYESLTGFFISISSFTLPIFKDQDILNLILKYLFLQATFTGFNLKFYIHYRRQTFIIFFQQIKQHYLFSKNFSSLNHFMKSVAKYPHQAFHSTDVKTAFKIASQTKFANLFLLDNPQTDVIFNPFYNSFESTSKPQFYGHFSILNPIHQLLTKKSFLNCRLVFNANDVYISPVCYKEKQLTHNVVPTWNYVAAQFKGIMKILPEEQLYPILCKQVEIFQSSVNSEWRLSDAPPEYVEKLKKRIFGVKVQVQEWKSHMKLAQKQRNQTEGVKNWSKKMESQKISITNWMDQFK